MAHGEIFFVEALPGAPPGSVMPTLARLGFAQVLMVNGMDFGIELDGF